MAGLYRFKTGFGGDIIHRAGSWDYPYKPLAYAAFHAAEKCRKHLRDARKHKKEK
jgi:lipid II:glycine glycyltransferase (peptidoglycan interpeptide bridge formation enzyme)